MSSSGVLPFRQTPAQCRVQTVCPVGQQIGTNRQEPVADSVAGGIFLRQRQRLREQLQSWCAQGDVGAADQQGGRNTSDSGPVQRSATTAPFSARRSSPASTSTSVSGRGIRQAE